MELAKSLSCKSLHLFLLEVNNNISSLPLLSLLLTLLPICKDNSTNSRSKWLMSDIDSCTFPRSYLDYCRLSSRSTSTLSFIIDFSFREYQSLLEDRLHRLGRRLTNRDAELHERIDDVEERSSHRREKLG